MVNIDWKTVLSYTQEDLNELDDEEKNDLFDQLLWFDGEKSKLDNKSWRGLFRATQEILKYKDSQINIVTANYELLKIEKEKEYSKSKHKRKKTPDDSYSEPDTASEMESLQEFKEIIIDKNKHIKKLLVEIEDIESDNTVLKQTLSKLRDELSDATNQLTQLNGENCASKFTCIEQQETITVLSSENEALRTQIQELIDSNVQRDKQIDSFSNALDTRVNEWKRIFDEKQTEIKQLKEIINQLSSRAPNYDIDSERLQVTQLAQSLRNRDEQIDELESKLLEATREMLESTDLINKLTNEKLEKQASDESEGNLETDLKGQLALAHERCRELQDKLASVEQDAVAKAEEVCSLMSQIREYESGQFGLSDAMLKIAEQSKRVRVRDKQIFQLVRDCNKLQEQCTKMEVENIALREKLNLPPESAAPANTILLNQRKKDKTLKRLQRTVDTFEEYKLQTKIEIRNLKNLISSLCKQIKSLGGEPNIEKEDMPCSEIGDGDKSSQIDLSDYDHKYTMVVEENEALRRGMHEILESIQQQDGSSDVQIISVTLEQLLQALDARHVAGWYHPAMRHQAEVHRMQGINAELRQTLTAKRLELKECKEELQKYMSSTQNLENKLLTTIEANAVIRNDSSIQTLEDEEESNKTYTIEEAPNVDSMCHLEDNVELKSIEVDHSDNAKEKADWDNSKQSFNAIIEELTTEKESLSKKLYELEEHWKMVSKDDDAKNKYLEESAKRNGKMVAENVVLERKCSYLEDNQKVLNTTVMNLQKQLLEAETKLKQRICELNYINEINLNNIQDLQNSFKDHIPISQFKSMEKEILSLTEKYRDCLEREKRSHTSQNKEIEILQVEVASLKSDKNKLNEMLIEKNKHIIKPAGDNDNISLSKLSELELSLALETQRADHTTNLMSVLKEQLTKSEKQCSEIEAQFTILKNAHISLQGVERDLRNQLVESVDIMTEYTILKENHALVKQELNRSKIEFQHIQEVCDIAQEQVRTQQHWMSSNEEELLSLRHQILDLQSHTENNHIIGRMSRELMLSRISESEQQTTATKLKLELDSVKDDNVKLKNKIEEHDHHHQIQINNSSIKISLLVEVVRSLQKQYSGCIPISTLEGLVQSMRDMASDKQVLLDNMRNMQMKQTQVDILKEELEVKLEILENKHELIDRVDVKLNELKYRRLAESLEMQLNKMIEKLNNSEMLITNLEEEILISKNLGEQIKLLFSVESKISTSENTSQTDNSETKAKNDTIVAKNHTLTVQTSEILDHQILKTQLTQAMTLVSDRSSLLLQSELKHTELQEKISILNALVSQKDELLLANRKAISELQLKTAVPEDQNTTEMAILKATITSLQSIVSQKEDSINRYQDLLKSDRDEHSKAAVRFQDELKHLQALLTNQEQTCNSHHATYDDAQIEQYKSRIYSMEQQMNEAKNELLALSAQLNATQESSDKWKALCDKRIIDIEKLKERVQQLHQSDKHVKETFESKLKILVQEKDTEIQNLNDTIEILQIEHERFILDHMEASSNVSAVEPVQRSDSLEKAKSQVTQLQTQLQVVRRQLTVVSKRERMAREEIRQLKGQLLKRPIVTARGDKTSTLREENLQKKMALLESELQEAKSKLEKETSVIEARRIKSAEDLGLWEKQKRWQQTAEKLKEKLKEKCEEFDKLQQSYAGVRNTVTRLEREKTLLEMKFKSGRGSCIHLPVNVEALEIEKSRLEKQVATLSEKLELHQHAICYDGATSLQERLEAQQRRISALEIAGKGSASVVQELENLHATVGSLQRANLSLEAQNLQLQLDLERLSTESPRLKEQVNYLENYVSVLKEELSHATLRPTSDVHVHAGEEPSKRKSTIELERTVLALRGVINKLQVENKRLLSGKPVLSTHFQKDSQDKLKSELSKIKQLYADSLKRVSALEEELNQSRKENADFENSMIKQNGSIDTIEELKLVKSRLAHKTQLLDKVKVLLTRAAAKEKVLREQVAILKRRQAPGDEND